LLAPWTEQLLVELATIGGLPSGRETASSSYQKWKDWFAQLGDVGTLKGRVPTGVTVGVLRLLKYGSRAQLEALEKLVGQV